MPTYEYKCPKCKTEFEVFQKKMSAKPGARCPKCGATADRLLSGGGGLVFKGTGFYITDYKRAGEKKGPDEGGAAPSDKPSKPESKPHAESKPKKKKDD